MASLAAPWHVLQETLLLHLERIRRRTRLAVDLEDVRARLPFCDAALVFISLRDDNRHGVCDTSESTLTPVLCLGLIPEIA